VSRSEITIDLGAVRHNARLLREAAFPAELWAVVKADAYGHGAADVAGAALAAGATALCVATVAEGAALRRAYPDARVIVMGPLGEGEEETARAARLEVTVSSPRLPEGLAVHAKIDTGMGRWGMSVDEALELPPERLAGVMSHLATADELDDSYAREQIDRFRAIATRLSGVAAHLANSAATLRFPEARFDAVRCGLALYGLSPFGDDPHRHGLEPVLTWRSEVALVKRLGPGESTGYGRRFVADRDIRIGVVPIGYADGWRRGLAGTEVLVGTRRTPVLGTISMDAFAIEIEDEPVGTPVTLIGDGVLAEEHARRLGTINYEITSGIVSGPLRASRRVVHG
jgi:alanine racemase